VRAIGDTGRPNICFASSSISRENECVGSCPG
jgi:hypothetical protein